MPFDDHANFAVSAVATAPSPADSGTSLTVTTGEGTRFPAVPFNVSIWPTGQVPTPDNAEIARVTALAGDVLTLTRAQEGTVARTVVIGDSIAATITDKTLTDLETPLEIVNVTSYGAVGDGATDDTVAIQAAIDAVKGTVQTVPSDHTGMVWFPAGTYLLSAPLNTYSHLILRGVGSTSLLKASGAFVGTALVNLASVGTYYIGGELSNLGFESAAGSGIAAIQSVATNVTNNHFHHLWFNSAHGLLLTTYTQMCVLEHCRSDGPVDKFLHLKGNFNVVRHFDKEGGTGTSTDPYIMIERHTSSFSNGNVLEHILIEQTCSANKSGMSISETFNTTIRDYWYEPTATDGYALRISGSYYVRLEGQLVQLKTTQRLKVDTTREVWIERLDTNATNAAIGSFLEIDATSRVTVQRAYSRRGDELYRLDQNLTVAEHYAANIASDANAGWSPVNTARYLTAQNLLVNPSFEAGRYGWTFSTVPTTTEEYIASEVGPGLMGHFKWSSSATYQLRQAITVPTEWIGRPLTLSFLAKVTGAGWIQTTISGVGLGATNPFYNETTVGSGWCLNTQTFTPQSAGTLQVGIWFVTMTSASDAYVDDCHLAFGTAGIPNPAKWASYELNGKTHTVAAAIPTTGTWKVGDVVWHSTPTASLMGWQCLTAGSPGTWNPLGGGLTSPMTTLGDLITGGPSGAPGRLGIGAANTVLTVVAGLVQWQALPVDPGFANPLTTLGDLLVGGASGVPSRLGIGSDTQILTLAGGVPTWAAPATPPAAAPAYPLLAPDGTAAAPSYSFAGNSATGFFMTTGSMDFSASGTAAMRLQGNGLWLRQDVTNLYMGAGPDVILTRDGPGILAQKNGATAQTLRVYGTYTDASNYELASLSHTTGTGVVLAAQTAGTGADNLGIALTPAGTGKVTVTSGQLIVPDGTAALPALTFSTYPTTGLFISGGNRIGFASSGVAYAEVTADRVYMKSTANFGWSASTIGGTHDLVLARGAAGILNLRGASSVGGAINWIGIATPTTPAAGQGLLYMKTDKKLYFLNDASVETALF